MCHFFCQQCWDKTLSRVQCELAACTGCAIGAVPFCMNTMPLHTSSGSSCASSTGGSSGYDPDDDVDMRD